MSRRKAVLPAEPKLPPSHLSALREAGFTITAYLDKAVRTMTEDGERSEWLPRLCIGMDPRTARFQIIEWLPAGHPANHYAREGYFPSAGHTNGGFHETPLQALAWFSWIKQQDAR